MLIQLIGGKNTSATLIPKAVTVNGVYSATDYGADGFNVFTVAVPEPTGTLNITTNGTQDVTSYANVSVAVPNGTETKNITANGTYIPTAPNIGFSSVTVNVPGPTGTLNVTTNGVKDVAAYAYVDVAVPAGGGAVIDSLSITPSTSVQTITAPGGVDGYSPITVSAVDNTIDANIVAGNIKSGVTILGITGNYGAPTYYIEKTIDMNGKAKQGSYLMKFTGITDVDDYVFNYAYYNANISGGITFPSLASISGNTACANMFNGCTGITSVDMSSLTTISGNYACDSMFKKCTGITSINLSALTTVSGNYAVCNYMFDGCTNLTGSINLNSLTTINASCAYMFNNTSITGLNLSSLTTISTTGYLQRICNGCLMLTTVNLSSLNSIKSSRAFDKAFCGCTSLTTLSFPALKTTSFGSYTNQFIDMLSGVTGCTVHFPSNLQAVIGSWADVTAGFGGTNTTVLFDLPATT